MPKVSNKKKSKKNSKSDVKTNSKSNNKSNTRTNRKSNNKSNTKTNSKLNSKTIKKRNTNIKDDKNNTKQKGGFQETSETRPCERSDAIRKCSVERNELKEFDGAPTFPPPGLNDCVIS